MISYLKIAALRAYRKPDVTITRSTITEKIESNPIYNLWYQNFIQNKNNGKIFKESIDENLITSSMITEVILPTVDEKEPLPLALHHTPICISFGIFRNIKISSTDIEDKNNHVI